MRRRSRPATCSVWPYHWASTPHHSAADSADVSSLNTFLPLRENFLKKRFHHPPRSLVGELVVTERRHPDAVRVRIREAVFRAAIADHLPIRACLGHFIGERFDLTNRHHRIAAAGVDQDLRVDLARGGALALQPAMKSHDTFQRGSVSSELPSESTAHAKTDRCPPTRIGLRKRRQFVECDPRALASFG